MSEKKLSVKDVRMNKKAVIIRLVILLALVLLAGIATRVIPQGAYDRQTVDGHTTIVENSFHFLETSPEPVWTWFISPFTALVSSSTTVMILLMLLFMGGIMVILDKAKIILFLVSFIIRKFGNNKYRLLYVMSGAMMLLGAVLSFYNSCGIFIPLALGISFAVGWDSLVGIGLSYLPIALGFSASMVNMYTIGIPQSIAGLPVNSGLWLRMIFFVVMYVLYVTFLRSYAKKIEADPTKSVSYQTDGAIRSLFPSEIDESIVQDRKVRRGAIWFACCISLIFVYTLVSLFVKGLSSLAMPMTVLFMMVGSIGGSLLSGRVSVKDVLTGFLQGMRITLPAVLVLLLIVGIRQIIIDGQIMDTLLYYCYSAIGGTSPYIAIFIILAITMLMEFVVGSASAKAFLILPLLIPLGNLVGLTSQTVVQAYAYGDGFANAFYPTSTMLLVITGIINISFAQWYKFTARLIVRIIAFVVVTLLICVAIGYGPF